MATQKELASVSGLKELAQGLAFSPDGLLLASASFDGSVRFLRLATGKAEVPLTGIKGGAHLSGGTRSALPGQQFSYQLEYGNRGSVEAASTVVTLTLPAGLGFIDASVPPTMVGDQLVWQVGDLAGVEAGMLTITVQVDADALLGQLVSLTAEIETSSSELEQLNNTSQQKLFLGYIGILPIIRR